MGPSGLAEIAESVEAMRDLLSAGTEAVSAGELAAVGEALGQIGDTAGHLAALYTGGGPPELADALGALAAQLHTPADQLRAGDAAAASDTLAHSAAAIDAVGEAFTSACG